MRVTTDVICLYRKNKVPSSSSSSSSGNYNIWSSKIINYREFEFCSPIRERINWIPFRWKGHVCYDIVYQATVRRTRWGAIYSRGSRVSREIKVQRRDKSRRSPLLHRFGAPLAHLATCTEYTGCHEERGSSFHRTRSVVPFYDDEGIWPIWSVLLDFTIVWCDRRATLSPSFTSFLLHHFFIPNVSTMQGCRFVLNIVCQQSSHREPTRGIDLCSDKWQIDRQNCFNNNKKKFFQILFFLSFIYLTLFYKWYVLNFIQLSSIKSIIMVYTMHFVSLMNFQIYVHKSRNNNWQYIVFRTAI